jgi:hypothetical protein
VEELERILRSVGFAAISIREKTKSDEIIRGWNFGDGVEHMVFSAYIRAKKPVYREVLEKSQ